MKRGPPLYFRLRSEQFEGQLDLMNVRPCRVFLVPAPYCIVAVLVALALVACVQPTGSASAVLPPSVAGQATGKNRAATNPPSTQAPTPAKDIARSALDALSFSEAARSMALKLAAFDVEGLKSLGIELVSDGAVPMVIPPSVGEVIGLEWANIQLQVVAPPPHSAAPGPTIIFETFVFPDGTLRYGRMFLRQNAAASPTRLRWPQPLVERGRDMAVSLISQHSDSSPSSVEDACWDDLRRERGTLCPRQQAIEEALFKDKESWKFIVPLYSDEFVVPRSSQLCGLFDVYGCFPRTSFYLVDAAMVVVARRNGELYGVGAHFQEGKDSWKLVLFEPLPREREVSATPPR